MSLFMQLGCFTWGRYIILPEVYLPDNLHNSIRKIKIKVLFQRNTATVDGVLP